MRDFVVVDLSYCHISNVGLPFDQPSVALLNLVRKCEEIVKYLYASGRSNKTFSRW